MTEQQLHAKCFELARAAWRIANKGFPKKGNYVLREEEESRQMALILMETMKAFGARTSEMKKDGGPQ